jgi:hypothetical protein
MLILAAFSLAAYAQTAAPAESDPQLPPELLRQLIDLSEHPQSALVSPWHISWPIRAILAFAGVLIFFAGIILSRHLHYKSPLFVHPTSVFLLLGVFGGIAALLWATAITATIYIHLAAAICTFISGFTITIFLGPQFNSFAKWLIRPDQLNINQELTS